MINQSCLLVHVWIRNAVKPWPPFTQSNIKGPNARQAPSAKISILNVLKHQLHSAFVFWVHQTWSLTLNEIQAYFNFSHCCMRYCRIKAHKRIYILTYIRNISILTFAGKVLINNTGATLLKIYINHNILRAIIGRGNMSKYRFPMIKPNNPR